MTQADREPAVRVSVIVPGAPGIEFGHELPEGVELVCVEPDAMGLSTEPLPAGAAILSAAAQASGEVVVISSPDVRFDELPVDELVQLLLGPHGVAAVVPCVLDERGLLAEAGAVVLEEGLLTPLGVGDDATSSDYMFRRDVVGTASGCVAVRRESLAQLMVPPDAAGVAGAVAEIVVRLVPHGRVVVEPRWRVTSHRVLTPCLVTESNPDATLGSGFVPVAGHRVVAARDSGTGTRVLFVTGTIPGSGREPHDATVCELLSILSSLTATVRITLLILDGAGLQRAVQHYRDAGFEVIVGGHDWEAWFARRPYHFSHVLVTDVGLFSSLHGHIERSQPQAARILVTGALPFRAVQALEPITPFHEREGLRFLDAHVRTRISARVQGFDTVWCESRDDADYLRGLFPSLEVLYLPPSLPESGSPRPLEERHGCVVLASPAADIIAGHEDAAVWAARHVLPLLRHRAVSTTLSVLTSRPSPMVRQLGKIDGVDLRSADDLATAAGSGRVLLAPYLHGTGGAAALRLAIATGTPFVTTSAGARGLVLGELEATSVFDDRTDFVQQAWELLHDDDLWQRRSDEIARLRESAYGADTRSKLIEGALVDLGIDAPTSLFANPWPVSPLPLPKSRWRMAVAPSVRPADSEPARLPPAQFAHLEERERYQLWACHRGPTEAAQDSLAREVAKLAYQPQISIITPVYNPAPEILDAMINSVRAQCYGDWQLCLADHASGPEIREVLAKAAAMDRRTHVVCLTEHVGIAGASNAALELAQGEFVALVDHDDLLKPHALAQVVRWLNAAPELDLLYSDEDKLDDEGRLVQPHLKPDWAPDLLMSRNYIAHLLVVRRSFLDEVGRFRPGFEGSENYDLALRLVESTDRIAHIPEPLYSCRSTPGSGTVQGDAKPGAPEAAKLALDDALRRRGRPGKTEDGPSPGLFRVRYALPGRPRVSIIVPTRDGLALLKRCIDSVLERSTYDNYEIVVIDNGSRDPSTLAYLANFPGRVIRYDHPFNYARMMNLAAWDVECDAMLFLNNDTEVISPDWIEALLEHGMRPEVGAVGGRLYYPDGRIQHEGILCGVLGTATNVDHCGYWGLGDIVRNCSAVTGACTMIRPRVYWEVGGNDERLRVAYNDVDICLRIRQAGYEVVYTPHAQLRHYESATRSGYEHAEDSPWFEVRWRQFDEWDDYYNRNFDRWALFHLAL